MSGKRSSQVKNISSSFIFGCIFEIIKPNAEEFLFFFPLIDLLFEIRRKEFEKIKKSEFWWSTDTGGREKR
jgi:hypothetical protein